MEHQEHKKVMPGTKVLKNFSVFGRNFFGKLFLAKNFCKILAKVLEIFGVTLLTNPLPEGRIHQKGPENAIFDI